MGVGFLFGRGPLRGWIVGSHFHRRQIAGGVLERVDVLFSIDIAREEDLQHFECPLDRVRCFHVRRAPSPLLVQYNTFKCASGFQSLQLFSA